MSNLNSWEDDPAAQDENLARRTGQVNLNQQQQDNFRPNAQSFQPTAQSFQPGQPYGRQTSTLNTPREAIPSTDSTTTIPNIARAVTATSTVADTTITKLGGGGYGYNQGYGMTRTQSI